MSSDDREIKDLSDKRESGFTYNRVFLCFIFAACAVILIFETIVRTNVFYIWDDAYMFVRYADNILSNGSIAWNPGGPPTYGVTSMLFLIIVLPIRLLFPGSPLATAWMASSVSGLAFFALLILLIKKYANRGSPLNIWLFVLIFAVFAFSAEHIATHLTTGMDTMFVICFVAIYIIAGKWFEQKQTVSNFVVLGLLGGIAYFIRPDLLIITYTIPGIMILFATGRNYRYMALGILAITVLITGVSLIVSYLYFDSALPLPFFVKGLKSYGMSIYRYYSFVPYRQLFEYSLSYSPFVLLIAGGILVNPKKWLRESSALEKGLLVSLVLFIVYYTFFVLQVMFYHARFYYPILPIIIYLGCRGAVYIYNELPIQLREGIQQITNPVRITALVIVLGILIFPLVTASNHLITRIAINETLVFDLGKNSKRIWNWEHYWLQLDEFSALPDDLVIATTEVGLPAVMNPGKAIVDMAGLHETEIAHNGFSADYVFEEYNPDLVYLPHPHYVKMIEEIKSNKYFNENYDLYLAEDFGVLMDVGVRKDSKYYKDMTRIIEEAPIIE